MTSQISLSKLMKIDIRSRRWLIVLSSVIQFVFGPIVGLMSITTKGNYTIHYAVNRAFNYEYAILESAIVIVGAVLVSLIGFRFLFSKRMMDLYGSVPVSRNRMFWAVYINNFLIWFIPFIVCMALTCLMSIVFDSANAGEILAMAGQYIFTGVFAFLIVYHMCLVAVMISGHPFVAITNILMMGVSVISLYGMIYYFASSFLKTFDRFNFTAVDLAWLSPVAVPFYVPGIVNDAYMEFTNYTVFIIGSVVLLMVNVVLARYLFIKRKSELAEGGTKIRPYVIIIRSVASVISGIYMAMSLAIFAIGTVHVWSIIGIIIGGVASFGIVNMILHRTGRAFFKDKFVMIGTVAGTILLYVMFVTDLFGFDTYLPAQNYIAKAEIKFPGYYDDGTRLIVEDGKVVSEDWNLTDREFCYETDDAALIHELLAGGVEGAKAEDNSWVSIWESVAVDEYNYYDENTNFRIKVYLSNGTSYYRNYHISNDNPVVAQVIDSREYRENNYPLSTGAISVMPKNIYFYCYDDNIVRVADINIENPELIEMILECYRRDFAENPVFNIDTVAALECNYVIYDGEMESIWDNATGKQEAFYHFSYCSLSVGKEYKRIQSVMSILNGVNYYEYEYNQDAVEEHLKEAIQEVLDLG